MIHRTFGTVYTYFVLFLLVWTVNGQEETFGDFETLTSGQGWYYKGCTVDLNTDSFTGHHSLHVINRQAAWGGIYFDVSVKPLTNYYFHARIKLLNISPRKLTSNVQVTNLVNSTGHGSRHQKLGEVRFMQPNIWQEIGGDFTTPPDVTGVSIYVQLQDIDVNYLLDSAVFNEVPSLSPTWRQDSDTLIDKLRKDDIHIRVQEEFGSSNLTVELQQLKSEFAFGSAVNAEYIVNPNYKGYQDFFYDTFEWGVLENKLKWKQMEWSHGHVNHDLASNAINAMVAKGTKIRAHNIFWGIEKNIPKWQSSIPDDQIKGTLVDRLNDIVPFTKGKVEHWDVNNENIHGNYYEEKTGYVNLTMWMFRETHKLDPKVKLFLNDFAVVNERYSGEAYYNQGMLFKTTPDVPIYGLGVQSHLKTHVDPEVLKFRLDRLARIGLPIWITELDISNYDVNAKADYLEDVLRLYFSYPSIEGIMFWGFWSGHISKPAAALADGSPNTVKANPAGERLRKLIKQDWRTNESKSLSSGATTIRAFRGDYSLKLLKNGQIIYSENFTLSKGGRYLDLHLTGSTVSIIG
ncbi:uncharacterized protein LOC126812937 isoform X1 [Patella vulgata]|uniref:uncharacterized protein LOC126812937 isoform X1 n=1 Tax=Patella vulgata TaxID=6465 RepID=UPI00217F5BA7|nr:uncharacterized protein LOC126812937 isoform X1 [Patella vulgata]